MLASGYCQGDDQESPVDLQARHGEHERDHLRRVVEAAGKTHRPRTEKVQRIQNPRAMIRRQTQRAQHQIKNGAHDDGNERRYGEHQLCVHCSKRDNSGDRAWAGGKQDQRGE